MSGKKAVIVIAFLILAGTYCLAKGITLFSSPRFDFKASGIVIDDSGAKLTAVKASITTAKPAGPFTKYSINTTAENIEGTFNFEYGGIAYIKINFTKSGYFPEEYDLDQNAVFEEQRKNILELYKTNVITEGEYQKRYRGLLNRLRFDQGDIKIVLRKVTSPPAVRLEKFIAVTIDEDNKEAEVFPDIVFAYDSRCDRIFLKSKGNTAGLRVQLGDTPFDKIYEAPENGYEHSVDITNFARKDLTIFIKASNMAYMKCSGVFGPESGKKKKMKLEIRKTAVQPDGSRNLGTISE